MEKGEVVMEKIDQKVLEKQISTVYAAQTKKVQELLETVALELNKKEKKEILFTLDRNKAKQMYHVGKVVNKTKDEKRNESYYLFWQYSLLAILPKHGQSSSK